MQKKIISKTKFLKLNAESAKKMAMNKALKQEANKVLFEADKFRWMHQTTWLGEPILNLPQDMFAIQEIIWKTKPEYIIEVGVAWGGSLLFQSMLMDYTGGKKIIGIDIFIPNDLKQRLKSQKKLFKKIKLIESSSLEDETVKKIKTIIKESKKVMVILDSHHTEDHVLKELNIYSKFISKGNYLICGDTIIDFIPEQKHRPRPWGPKNNPHTALKKFIKKNKRFKTDKEIENKLLFSCNPNGYLKASI
tara:strand:+ start:172 stop:918 length:747 start_codon:yes stop_codon:yes gene_type:complete